MLQIRRDTDIWREEGGWFLDLKKRATDDEQEMMTARYIEEFERYTGESGLSQDDEELDD